MTLISSFTLIMSRSHTSILRSYRGEVHNIGLLHWPVIRKCANASIYEFLRRLFFVGFFCFHHDVFSIVRRDVVAVEWASDNLVGISIVLLPNLCWQGVFVSDELEQRENIWILQSGTKKLIVIF